MRGKVQRDQWLRRALPIGVAGAVCLPGAATPHDAEISGRIVMIDKGDRPAEDVGQAVVWLAGASAPVTPVEVEIGTSDKAFSPHVLAVPAGSTVGFPNHDPFNHNVFSLSEGNAFDLGLYGRGETRAMRFTQPGIVRVYCNVHAQMSAIVVVRDNPYFAQPSSDGSFRLASVPPGRYTLHLWHERAPEVTRELIVPDTGVGALVLELDARGYRFTPHRNKHGQPYPQQGRRY